MRSTRGLARLVENGVADTFGYVYNAFYTVWQIDNDSPDPATRKHVERFRDEVRKSLANLDQPKYRSFRWECDQADGYADAIEVRNLYNREQEIPGLANWIDSESRVMWNMQQPSGLINEGHPDGNFARTTLMVADSWRRAVCGPTPGVPTCGSARPKSAPACW